MKKGKLLAGVLIAGASAAYAFGGFGSCDADRNCTPQKSCEKMAKVCKMKNMDRSSHCMGAAGHSSEMGFMKHFMMSLHSMSLSKDQMKKIGAIMGENQPKFANPAEAFDEDKFDTQKFIDTMQNQKSQMLKHQALVIEKIYAVLTPEQKKQMLNDFKDIQMKGKSDKGATCRR